MIITQNPIVISFPSILELTDPFVRFTEELCVYLEFERQIVDNVVLAIDEALVNAIRHGNKNDPALYATLEFHMLQEGLKIIVADLGSGFSLDDLADPLDAENLLKRGGRGVFLMKSLMESVEFSFNNPGTKVSLFVSYNYKP